MTTAKQVGRDDAVAVKQLAALERERQIEAMLLEHLDKQLWVKLLDRAQAAATQGESSFELIRFPCDLCSDGGRKIDVAEIDWPSTLRGEAAEVYARWERELRPGGFRLRAQIVEYLDGIPNNIALSLSWATSQSDEIKQRTLSDVGGFGSCFPGRTRKRVSHGTRAEFRMTSDSRCREISKWPLVGANLPSAASSNSRIRQAAIWSINSRMRGVNSIATTNVILVYGKFSCVFAI